MSKKTYLEGNESCEICSGFSEVHSPMGYRDVKRDSKVDCENETTGH